MTNTIQSQSSASSYAGSTGSTASTNGSDAASMSNLFTTLLVAQIRTQDPLNPMDSSQFVTQLTQLSQVEALQNMADQTSASAAMMESMLVVSLGSQVGTTVMAKTGSVEVGDSKIHGGFTLNDTSGDVTVTLTGSDGVEHTLALGTKDAGDVGFDIDPQALGLPPGKYSIKVGTATGEKPQVEIAGKLESVSLGANGQVVLKVAGVGATDTASITRFLGNPNPTI